MKKHFVTLLFAVLPSAAFAAETVGDPCPQTGHQIAQVGNEVLGCVDGKWEITGHVGAVPVTLDVRIMEGDKHLASSIITTLDGQPVPVIAHREEGSQRGSSAGDFFIITPTRL